MIPGLPDIDAATLEKMAIGDQRELLVLLDRADAMAARDDFLAYMLRTTPGFIPTVLHREMADALMRVERGETKRLLIEIPVRFGKTTMAARRWPAWCMARRRVPFMLCSYGGDLATESGRHLRNCILDDAHLSVFPEAAMSKDTSRADQFSLVNGSTFLAAGAGGPILGRGWRVACLDDLLRGREAADSKIQRDAVWRWYESDFLSRQEYDPGLGGNALVYITARWSDDDPAARIRELHERGIEEWEIISYPALDQDDRSLAEELVPAKQLKAIRAQVSSRVWGSLYQSNPVPDDGDVYRRQDFIASDETWTPSDREAGSIVCYGASDIASTADGGDYTVHSIVGVDRKGLLHIVHLWRQQVSSAIWIDRMISLAAIWKPMRWVFGSGLAYKMAEPAIRKAMREAGTYVALDTVPERGDKVSRSQSFAARHENHLVRWNKAAPWYAQAESEMLRFQSAKRMMSATQ